MIRKVAAHVQSTDGDWIVHLRCGHKVYTAKEDHCRAIKGRFCPSCPGAERALKADYKNEIEHRMMKVIEASKPLADHLRNYGKDPA